ncbi:acetylglutamate kinase [Elusimicrobiota bacterium]
MAKENIKLIKIGGSLLDSMEAVKKLIGSLKSKIVPGETIIVHGGGNAINFWMKKNNIEPEFVDGQRVTDEKAIKVVEMVLSGLVNKEIVNALTGEGYNAVGISGRDGNLAIAKIKDERLGYVGEVDQVEPDILLKLMNEQVIPVVSPVCNGSNEEIINVNADFFASAVAIAVDASELNVVTDTGGVIKEEKLIEQISAEEIEELKDKGIISKGMIPKLQAAVNAKKGGVEKVNILNYEGKVGTSII